MANPTEHIVTIQPCSVDAGVSARDLIETTLRFPQVKCPVCSEAVAIPTAIDQQVRGATAQPGGADHHFIFSVHHPGGVSIRDRGQSSNDPALATRAAQTWKEMKGKGK